VQWRSKQAGHAGRQHMGMLKRLILIPGFDELALFLMSVAFVVLYATEQALRAESRAHIFSGFNLLALFLFVFFIAGIVFSIYHAFRKRPKTDIEKLLMLFFAIVANYVSGLAAAIYIFKQSLNWWIVFPAWNLFNGVILVLMAGLSLMDETYVADRDVKPSEAVVGLLFLCGLLLVCQQALDLYWAITFSICVGYATSLSRTIQRVTNFASFWKKTP